MKTEKVIQPWYALRVKSQHEKTVAMHLHARGFETFLPTYQCRRRWSDRFKVTELPLFPGYVFSRFNPLDRLPIVSIPGVVAPVSVGRAPVPVDETEVAAIQAAVEGGLRSQPWPFLQLGQKVRIEEGPLCGVEGVLVAVRGQERLVLSITLLQRSVAVHIEKNWVRPLQTDNLSRPEHALSSRSSHKSATTIPRVRSGEGLILWPA